MYLTSKILIRKYSIRMIIKIGKNIPKEIINIRKKLTRILLKKD